MSNKNDDYFSAVKRVDADIAANQELVEKAKKLKQLQDSPIWKEIIEEGYFTDEAKRIPDAILNTDNVFKKENVDTMVQMLVAIRFFKQYIDYIRDDGLIALENIEKLEEYKQQLKYDFGLETPNSEDAIDVEVEAEV
jgi:hypothetical protein